ncbi:MAG: hypothetical protein EXS05_13825 [Planctomycetaceae bacterium]|nr:hypothetical protein [Planctomycetaceae bacterium]
MDAVPIVAVRIVAVRIVAVRIVAVRIVAVPTVAVPIVAVRIVAVRIVAVPMVAVPMDAVPMVVVPIVAVPMVAVPIVAVPMDADPMVVVPMLADPMDAVPMVVVPMVVVPMVADPMDAVPMLAVPMLVVPIVAVPIVAVPIVAVPMPVVPMGVVPMGVVLALADSRNCCAICSGRSNSFVAKWRNCEKRATADHPWVEAALISLTAIVAARCVARDHRAAIGPKGRPARGATGLVATNVPATVLHRAVRVPMSIVRASVVWANRPPWVTSRAKRLVPPRLRCPPLRRPRQPVRLSPAPSYLGPTACLINFSNRH